MLADPNDKPGTTDGDTGDDATALTESTEAADREAGEQSGEDKPESQRTDWKALYLTQVKPLQEKLNRLESQLEERGGTQASPTDDRQPPANQQAQVRLQGAIAALLPAAEKGDPYAIANLEALRMQLEARQEMERRDARQRIDTDLSRLGDEERDKVEKYLREHWGEVTSVRAARLAVRGEEAEQQSKTLAARERAANEAKARAESGELPRTSVREVPAAEVKARVMSDSAFDAKVRELEAAGKGHEAFDLKRQLHEGKIVLKG